MTYAHKTLDTDAQINETLLQLETGNTICPPATSSKCFSAVFIMLSTQGFPVSQGEGEGGVNKRHIKTLHMVLAAMMEGNH